MNLGSCVLCINSLQVIGAECTYTISSSVAISNITLSVKQDFCVYNFYFIFFVPLTLMSLTLSWQQYDVVW